MTDPETADQKSVYSHMVRGSMWTAAMRWGVRGIGLVSTLILARLLLPEDFGIVAMAMLTFGILDVFFEMGVDLYLIRNTDVSREDWDTAWTFRVLQGLALGGLLLILAPLAEWYFGEPRVVSVIHFLALSAVFRGAQNVGVIKFRKDLDFASDFRFGIYSRLAMFCITVPAAVILQTYWALVIGQVAGTLLQTILSFWMHPYRPRLCLASARPLFNFSIPIVLLSASNYMNDKVDSFVVGGIADSAKLGPYTIASSISLMVSAEAVGPISRALFPNYAKIIDDPDRFRPAYLHSVRAVAILCAPLCLGLSSVAHDFVLVVLGSKWTDAIPLMEWLAIYSLAFSIAYAMGPSLLLVPGGERRAMILSWVRVAMTIPMVTAAGSLWGVKAVAIAATLANFAYVPMLVHQITRVLPVTGAQIIGALWPPIAAAALMSAIVRLVDMPDVLPAVSLATDVVVGVAVYSLTLAALWHLSGRPQGPERAVLHFIADRTMGRLRG